MQAQETPGISLSLQDAQRRWMLCTRDAAIAYSVLSDPADVIARGALGRCAVEFSAYLDAVNAEADAKMGYERGRSAAEAIVERSVAIQRDVLTSTVLSARLARREGAAGSKPR